MNALFNLFIFVLISCLFISPLNAQDKIKIACVGDSITFGAGIKDRAINSYPAQLQVKLGPAYDVQNFGLSGATLLRTGDKPYHLTSQYQQSLQFKPDIVLIKLGTNDTKTSSLEYLPEFKSDYKTLIDCYVAQIPQCRVILVVPIRAYGETTNARLRQKIAPLIEELAYETQLEIFDAYSIFGAEYKQELMPDKTHPSAAGAAIMAEQIARYLTTPRDASFDIFKHLPEGQAFNFHGYQGKNFQYQGISFKVVQAKNSNPEHAWVLRARFWGHEAQLDLKLLELGFHLVYCDVTNLYGSPEALARWDRCYQILCAAGLHKKLILEGMSRGALPVYHWAARNTDKVIAIYADAPVMDIKSWPLGQGASKGSPADVANLVKAYKLSSQDDILTYMPNPIDYADIFAKSDIALIHVVGDVDSIVPYSENTAIFAQRLEEQGGHITLISKKGVNHHPHSLSAPEPILSFLLNAWQSDMQKRKSHH